MKIIEVWRVTGLISFFALSGSRLRFFVCGEAKFLPCTQKKFSLNYYNNDERLREVYFHGEAMVLYKSNCTVFIFSYIVWSIEDIDIEDSE